jgi:hypothetical protein
LEIFHYSIDSSLAQSLEKDQNGIAPAVVTISSQSCAAVRSQTTCLYEGNAGSACLTAEQLFDHVKPLKNRDEFGLVFIPTNGGEWGIERVSPYPKNGVVHLDCKAEISG